jgi:hypothetical protein
MTRSERQSLRQRISGPSTKFGRCVEGLRVLRPCLRHDQGEVRFGRPPILPQLAELPIASVLCPVGFPGTLTRHGAAIALRSSMQGMSTQAEMLPKRAVTQESDVNERFIRLANKRISFGMSTAQSADEYLTTVKVDAQSPKQEKGSQMAELFDSEHGGDIPRVPCREIKRRPKKNRGATM